MMTEEGPNRLIAFAVVIGVLILIALGCFLGKQLPAERPRIETAVPVMETVCAEPAEGYCLRYETRRILRE